MHYGTLRWSLLIVLFSTSLARALSPLAGGRNLTQCLAPQQTNITLKSCMDNCNGWMIAQPGEVYVWALPFFSFVLPAVVFSFIIPRHRELRVADRVLRWGLIWESLPSSWDAVLWPVWLRFLVRVLMYLGRALMSLLLSVAAFFFAIFDRATWIFMVFAFAGVHLVGALEEACLDFRILFFMHSNAVAERFTLLAILLVGNLNVSDHEAGVILRSLLSKTPNFSAPGQIRNDHPGPTQQSTRRQAPVSNVPNMDISYLELEEMRPMIVDHRLRPLIDCKTAVIRLRNVLEAQMPFADSVGGPVLFYLIAFAYPLSDAMSATNTDASIAIAFGMWWMTLVHVAIVSGCLLASNNPSTIRAVVGKKLSPRKIKKHPTTEKDESSWFLALIYPYAFVTAPVWRRGVVKRAWLRRTNNDAYDLGSWSYFFIFLLATILVAVPCGTGIYVAYQTPQVGLSCRSLTILIYGAIQIVLIIHTCLLHLRQRQRRNKRWMHIPWYFSYPVKFNLILQDIILFVAMFVTFCGTLLQMLGVFRNCICSLSASKWFDSNAVLIIVQDPDIVKSQANRYWIWTGIFACSFMGLVCVLGWGYRLILKMRFEYQLRKAFEDAKQDACHLNLQFLAPEEDPGVTIGKLWQVFGL